jgi:hypothetical protein
MAHERVPAMAIKDRALKLADDMSEQIVVNVLCRPFWVMSVSGFAAWTTVHALVTPWRSLP